MRASTAILLLSAIGTLACANRGMHAPGPDSGPGTGGTGGTVPVGGQGGTSGTGGTGGIGGTGGGGTGGTSCSIPVDAGAATAGPCNAMFSFETGVQGAMINAGSTGFTMVAQSGAFTYCGTGALAITALFSGTSGSTTKGEVLIPLPAAPLDVTGKMITVHVAADPGCSSDLNLSLVLNTQAGPMYFTPTFPIRPVTNSWKTATVAVSPDGGATSALNLSLQAFSSTNYHGTIYVDEIDIR